MPFSGSLLLAARGVCLRTIFRRVKLSITIFVFGVRYGIWQHIHDEIYTKARQAEGREPKASAAAIDSQSVKAVALRGEHGVDVFKQTRGIKRHLLVDSLDFIIALAVTNASVPRREGAALLFSKIVGICQRLTIIWADGGYRGKLLDWVKEHFSWTLEIVLRSDKSKGFVVLPKRWIVERTNAWLGQSRRLNRQYEVLHQTYEVFVYIAMTRLILRRLDKAD